MRKKIMNVVLFLAVLAAALGMTLYVGNSAASVLIYNFGIFPVWRDSGYLQFCWIWTDHFCITGYVHL